MATTGAKLHLLTNVTGLAALFLTSAIVLWFASAGAFRVFYPRAVAEIVFLPAQPLPRWYRHLMRKWLYFLWSHSDHGSWDGDGGDSGGGRS